jgi:hypothetical protein
MDTPEVEAHAHHRTGIRWLDASLALSAFAISIISLFVAIHHGHTMREMAEANARMVAASSWPFVQYGSGNLGADGSQTISLSLTNQGVGPACIGKLEILYLDKPVKSTMALMKECCIKNEADLESVISPNDIKSNYASSQAEGRILAAREEKVFLALPRTKKNAAVWDRLNVERWKLGVQICYCSVFDECWTSGKAGTKATRVSECPADWVSYSE